MPSAPAAASAERTVFDVAAEGAAWDAAALLAADVAYVVFPSSPRRPNDASPWYVARREISGITTERRHFVPGPHPLLDTVLDSATEYQGDTSAKPSGGVEIRQGGCRAFLLLPIFGASGTRPFGALFVGWRRSKSFSTRARERARHVARTIGRAVGQVAEQARLAQEQLTTILSASSTMLVTYDLTGTIKTISGPSLAILGWTPEELVGQSLGVLLPPSDVERFEAKLAARRTGSLELIQYETRNLHRDGHLVPVFVTSGPSVEAAKVVGGAGAVTDLSRQKQLEQERDEAQAARLRAETAIRTGRAMVHELASPLGAILGLSELLASHEGMSQAMRQDLDLLSAEVVRAGELLQRFGRITHYEERPTPAGLQLDLEKASRGAEADQT